MTVRIIRGKDLKENELLIISSDVDSVNGIQETSSIVFICMKDCDPNRGLTVQQIARIFTDFESGKSEAVCSAKQLKTYGLGSVLHFGKHNGSTLADIIEKDKSYLFWCLQEIDDFIISDELANELDDKFNDKDSQNFGMAMSEMRRKIWYNERVKSLFIEAPERNGFKNWSELIKMKLNDRKNHKK